MRVRKLRELKTQGFGPEPYNKIGFHPPHVMSVSGLRNLLLHVQLLDDIPAIGQMVSIKTRAHASLIADLESESEAHVT